jgi:hypothetical protein
MRDVQKQRLALFLNPLEAARQPGALDPLLDLLLGDTERAGDLPGQSGVGPLVRPAQAGLDRVRQVGVGDAYAGPVAAVNTQPTPGLTIPALCAAISSSV